MSSLLSHNLCNNYAIDNRVTLCKDRNMSSLMREHSTPNPECFEDNPTDQTVLFGDHFINLSGISRVTGIARETVSRILSGNRKPNLDQAIKVSRCLGLGTDEFLNLLQDRIRQLDRKKVQKAQSHLSLVS